MIRRYTAVKINFLPAGKRQVPEGQLQENREFVGMDLTIFDRWMRDEGNVLFFLFFVCGSERLNKFWIYSFTEFYFYL